jgi:hypothetical protein
MKKHLTIFKKIIVFVMLFASWQMVEAQVTTASMSGRVTGTGNETLPGATVKAVHIPSGTTYGTTTNTEGRFSINGMRIGGPYTVEVSFMGYTANVVENIQLRLGENHTHNVNLREGAVTLTGVEVVGQSRFDANRTGAASIMDLGAISRMPTITASVADVIRLNPQVQVNPGNGAMSFAGTNNRYNSFQIDGAVSNDVFGLTASGMNGGGVGTQPISMEAIEQLQVSIAPFDVRQSGFTGGSINAVTKSGTNQFEGSVYSFVTNHSLTGRYEMMNGELSDKMGKRNQHRSGATLGGPIIKDKLFFFANYERTDENTENTSGLGATNSNIDPVLAMRIYDTIKKRAADQGVTYNGYLPTSFDDYTKNDKFGIKLDWNINKKHRASFRWSLVSGAVADRTPFSTRMNSTDYVFERRSKTNTFVAELQSQLANNMSNEFRASYVAVRDERFPNGSPFPMIEIANVRRADATGTATLGFGNERSSMANQLDQDVITFTNNFTLYKGNHTLTFGTHNEFFSFYNLFLEDNYGTYNFANPDDFFAGKIQQYRFQQNNVAVTGTPRWGASFGAGQIGFYAQNRWNATQKLDVTFGIRMDIPMFFDTPTANARFNAFSAGKGWDYKTNQQLSNSPLWSPRAGFRWILDDKSNYVLRGGTGVFSGRIPFVWLSNSFGNTGGEVLSYNTNVRAQLDNLSLILNPHEQNANASKLTAAGSQTINVFAPDFKFAQTWRTNLGLDFNIAGINWTAEAIFSKTINDILYQKLTHTVRGDSTFGMLNPTLNFDQRMVLNNSVVSGTPFGTIIALSNTNKGYSYNLSLQGVKKFDFGLELVASYAYTQSKAMNNGGSSVANSNFNGNYISGNPNNPELGFSHQNIPHRINVAAFYSKEFVKNQTTTIGLIYQGTSGPPFTLVYNGDINGDGASNDLIWIPTDAQLDQMNFIATSTFTADEQRENLRAFIERNPYLSKNRGKYAERNAFNRPFEHHFDLHFSHKINFEVSGRKQAFEITFDVLNVGNMLNNKWGRTYADSWVDNSIVYRPSDRTFQFLGGPNHNPNSLRDLYSRWRAQIGLRYNF